MTNPLNFIQRVMNGNGKAISLKPPPTSRLLYWDKRSWQYNHWGSAERQSSSRTW